MSTAAYAVTLTYAGDGPETATLIYSDFQKFMKRLRADGYTVRYIVAGEYGSDNGRAHWHVGLFFDGKAPELVSRYKTRQDPKQIKLDRNINWFYWPHGFSYFQEGGYRGFRYIMKYALKDQDKRSAQNLLSMSKKPPLGAGYFREWAERHVEQGLAPQTFVYNFADVFDTKRRRRQFYLQGRSRELFLEHYLRTWAETHDMDHPLSDLLEEYTDSLVDLDAERTDEEWRARLLDGKPPARLPVVGDEPEWSYGLFDGDIPVKYLRHPNGGATFKYGKERTEIWHENDPEAATEIQLRIRAPRDAHEAERLGWYFADLTSRTHSAILEELGLPPQNHEPPF